MSEKKEGPQSDNPSLQNIFTHASIWVIYFFYENGIMLVLYPSTVSLLSSAAYFILNITIFYAGYYIIAYNHNVQYRYLKLFIYLSLFTVAYLCSGWFLMKYISYVNLPNAWYTNSIKDFVVLRLFRFVYFMSVSYTYWLFNYKINTERNLLKLEKKRVAELERTALIEKEKLRSELNYLRLQLNPHFVFNTLSFIYTEVIKHSEKASKSVMLLSDIMRNAFKDPDPEGMIPLEDEIQQIQNLIEIHQLRYNKRMYINMETPDVENLKNVKIIPFILITFVENAFKYGTFLDQNHPFHIKIAVQDNSILFFMKNKKKETKTNIESNGVGLANVTKRLKIAYPEQHSLDIIDEPLFYTIDLKINT
ncbi:MAG: yehU 6 [Mucilaginibacter sp.]|nr:yehU 6 [Mucilaginibacter sp.]